MDKLNIKAFLPQKLKNKFADLGIEAYRASQVLNWLYKKKVNDFSAMTNLPAELKKILDKNFYINKLTLVKQLKSSDGTEKFLFSLADNKLIETVYIPTHERSTICLSTQVGCPLQCAFCASAQSGYERNLETDEIVNQIIFLEQNNYKINNVVFMGMGEPLLNYDNVLTALRIINDKDGLNIAARKITISTSGIIPAIKRLEREKLQFELSVSLHAPSDDLRTALMPINKKYPLKSLIAACVEYKKQTKRLITFEYILLNAINDTEEQAHKLVNLLKGFDCKVNILNFNPVQEAKFMTTTQQQADKFCAFLTRAKVKAFMRTPRGKDIEAACGQLRKRQISG